MTTIGTNDFIDFIEICHTGSWALKLDRVRYWKKSVHFKMVEVCNENVILNDSNKSSKNAHFEVLFQIPRQ